MGAVDNGRMLSARLFRASVFASVLCGCIGVVGTPPGAENTPSGVTPGATCTPETCHQPPVDVCLSSNVAQVHNDQGSCSANQCVYASAEVTCANGCLDGACVSPGCEAKVCNTPPADTCADANTLTTWSPDGTCDAQESCQYTSRQVACEKGCSANKCVDSLCTGKVCTASVPVCVGPFTLRTQTGGQCNEGTGQCTFVETDTKCPWGCVKGACAGVRVAAGGNDIVTAFACAVTDAGGVKCWGYNDSGQLGNGAKINSSVPVDATGLTQGIKEVAAGAVHACALSHAGAVSCWGRGDLGVSGINESLVPISVPSLASGVKRIAASSLKTCALTQAGAVLCWGRVLPGTFSQTPVAVPGLASGVTDITVGREANCARMQDGSAKCWGFNGDGELGNGTRVDSPDPVAVSSTGPFYSVSTFLSHTCGVMQTGAIQCWGNDRFSLFGNPDDSSSLVPVSAFKGQTDFHAVVAGPSTTLAITQDGKVVSGGIATATPVERTTGIVTGFPAPVLQISHAWLFGCAYLSTGRLMCFGRNDVGQLGNGTLTEFATPVFVTGF
jgi:alpha-tubulin suppressor-like RCC1 family protein